MNVVLKGKIVRIEPTMSVGSNGFQKREVHIEIGLDEQYSQFRKIEFHKDNTGIPDTLRIGQVCEFHINLNGREWEDKEGRKVVFNTDVCWKVKAESATVTPEPTGGESVGDGDLPF